MSLNSEVNSVASVWFRTRLGATDLLVMAFWVWGFFFYFGGGAVALELDAAAALWSPT